MSFGPDPWQQQSWDARAAVNFMAGGAGAGAIVFNALAGGPRWAFAVGAALVGLGLFSVSLELGRPLRALNVYRHPQRSWMSREAIAALALFASTAAAWAGVPLAGALAAAVALVFVYCQGCMLRVAKGIPAWREPLIVPLIVATGLAEGGGVWLLLVSVTGAPPIGFWSGWVALTLVLFARLALWAAWRQRIRSAPRALREIDRAGDVFKVASLLALAAAAAILLAPLPSLLMAVLQAAAGLLAIAGGQWFKFTLVTRGGFNQGFAIPHLPVRGVRRRGA